MMEANSGERYGKSGRKEKEGVAGMFECPV
jgi:hypothetical protein